jgi:hypothetical protein
MIVGSPYPMMFLNIAAGGRVSPVRASNNRPGASFGYLDPKLPVEEVGDFIGCHVPYMARPMVILKRLPRRGTGAGRCLVLSGRSLRAQGGPRASMQNYLQAKDRAAEALVRQYVTVS